jgi:hypothetical protein
MLLLSVLCMMFWGISGALGVELAIVTPTDGKEDVPNTICTLLWKVTSGDEDISSLYTYDIYFGSSAGALTTPVSQDLTVPAYTVSNLGYDTTYFWKVEAFRAGEDTLVSSIWRFSTWDGETLTFELVAPADISNITDPEEIGKNRVLLEQNLHWKCTVGGLLVNDLSYTVRLGKSGGSIPVVASGVTDMIYDPDLAYDQVYYWQITATAPDGRSWTGPIWKFYTTAQTTLGGSGCSLGSLSLGGILLLLPLVYGFLKKSRKL